jgi:hypothetical protein
VTSAARRLHLDRITILPSNGFSGIGEDNVSVRSIPESEARACIIVYYIMYSSIGKADSLGSIISASYIYEFLIIDFVHFSHCLILLFSYFTGVTPARLA